MTSLVSKNPDELSPYIISIGKSGAFSLNINMNVVSVMEFGRCMPGVAKIELFCFSVNMQSSGIFGSKCLKLNQKLVLERRVSPKTENCENGIGSDREAVLLLGTVGDITNLTLYTLNTASTTMDSKMFSIRCTAMEGVSSEVWRLSGLEPAQKVYPSAESPGSVYLCPTHLKEEALHCWSISYLEYCY